uniref:P-selectin glycoprotein ligand 1 n=1 Tax=Takifugu rubripes TaxID=31033 RepID=A0A510C4H8_TAKRU|nr:P-selectin glycoprotein ligand 1 [Takifugu rubripes]
MLPRSVKVCLLLLWGTSGLFSPKSLSVSVPVTSNPTSTSDPNATSEHLSTEPDAWSVSAAAEEETTDDSVAASVSVATSSSTPEQRQAFTAGDTGDSHSSTDLRTPTTAEGLWNKQSVFTSDRTPGAPSLSALRPEAAASTPSPVFTFSRSPTSDTSAMGSNSSSGGALGSDPTPSPVTKNLNLFVTSNSSSELTSTDGYTSGSAATSGSTSTPTSGSASGFTSGSASESTSGSTPGSTSTSTSGSASRSTSGSTPESISGFTSGSASESTSESTPGSTSGSTSGSTPGSASGSTPGSASGSTSGSRSIRPTGVFIPCETKMAPNPTNRQTPASPPKSPPATAGQPCSMRGRMSQCLIAIASLAGLAAIFMVSTVVLCAKLSTRPSKGRKQQPATEMMCISSLLPEKNYTYTRQRNPVPNGVLVIHNVTDSDEEGGDNLTLSSFLPENDRFV